MAERTTLDTYGHIVSNECKRPAMISCAGYFLYAGNWLTNLINKNGGS